MQPRGAARTGTLEYDRITLPAPAAERIVAVMCTRASASRRDSCCCSSTRRRHEADARCRRGRIREQRGPAEQLDAGPRREDIAQARAHLAAAQAQAREARAYYARVQPLGARITCSAADVDRARAGGGKRDAQVAAARAALDALLHGTRPEQIAQAQRRAGRGSRAGAAQRVYAGQAAHRAPRDGVVDSLPYKLGDQAAGRRAAGDPAGRRGAVCAHLRARAATRERACRRPRAGRTSMAAARRFAGTVRDDPQRADASRRTTR